MAPPCSSKASSAKSAAARAIPDRQALIPTERRGRGHPTKFRPKYCAQVIAHGRTGASLTAFAAKIGVARRTLNNWALAHPEFAEACEIAQAHACAWYEDRMRDVAKGNGGPGAATVAMFGVKNFGSADFQERQRVEHVGRFAHVTMTYEEAIEEARRRGLPIKVLEE
jgi:hypothetical protein